MITSKHKTFFNLARRISYKSPSQVKIGAVIVRGKQIQNVGINDMRKTHPRAKSYFGNFIHAELSALIGLSYEETRGADIFVYRETLNGEIAKSRPCRICQAELMRAGIKHVFYTSELGFHKERLY